MERQRRTGGPSLSTGCGSHLPEAQGTMLTTLRASSETSPVLFLKVFGGISISAEKCVFYSGVRRLSEPKLYAFSFPLVKELWV